MGKRKRRLRCQDCQRLFWMWFDTMTPDEMKDFADGTNCEYCDSERWEVTQETEFAGGDLGKKPYQQFECRECYESFNIDVSGMSPETMRKLADEIECQNDTCQHGAEQLRMVDLALSPWDVDERSEPVLETPL